MKTSLSLLKDTHACVGGYGRQASFWTVRPKAKLIEYPIWMVGLVGHYDDLSWAISNSLIVEDAEFQALKDRTFWPLFQAVFWRNVTENVLLKWAKEKKSIFRDALQDGLKINDRAQALAWMEKYSRYKISSPLFDGVINNACWTNPVAYLQTIHEYIGAAKSLTCLEHEKHPFDLDHHVPGHDTRTGKPVTKTVVRRASARRVDEDDEDEDEDAPRYAKKAAPKEEPQAITYFELPFDASGRVITDGERFAAVCVNGDPWAAALDFMIEQEVPKAIGSKMNVTKVSPDGVKPPQFAASLHLNEPRKIFQLMHLLQATDFNVLKACMVEQQAQALESGVARHGIAPEGVDHDGSVTTLEYTMSTGDDYAKKRITQRLNEERDGLRIGQPIAGAIAERTVAVGGSRDEAEAEAEPEDNLL